MAQCLAQEDILLLKLINNAQIKHFGNIQKNEVSHSTMPNKALMVSGSI